MNHSPLITTALFDLDGTLTDPFEGITRSVLYALEQFQEPLPPAESLRRYIGPPLRRGFAELLRTESSEQIELAMRYYRDRYSTIGLFENVPYDGIHATLATLAALPVRLMVATAKPTIFASQIIERYKMAPYFEKVYGSELDGRFDYKGELLAHMIEQEALLPDATVMIGDRMHDIQAAKLNGMHSIGVTYGYGSREELEQAGADWLCTTPQEVGALVRQLAGNNQ